MGDAEVLVWGGPGETRLALIDGGRVVEFAIDRGALRAGAVVLARVTGVNRKTGQAFADIGEAQAAVVVPAAGLTEGQAVTVRIAAAARPGKGAEATRRVELPGRYLTFTPSRPGLALSRRLAASERERLAGLLAGLVAPDEGVVVRTRAAAADDRTVTDELVALRRDWASIGDRAARAVAPAVLHAPSILEDWCRVYPVGRVRVDDPVRLGTARQDFPAAELWRDGPVEELCDAAETLEQALSPVVTLPGGASLLFGVAAGIAVVDIDAGPLPAAEANRRAMPEIARQLRLRGLGGHILIDVIPTRRADERASLVAALRAAVADDPVPTQVVGTTPLGMIEATRYRPGPSLAEWVLETPAPHPNAVTAALAGLAALVAESRARPGARLVLAARGAVLDEVRRRADAVAEAARQLGMPPRLVADEAIMLFEIREDRR